MPGRDINLGITVARLSLGLVLLAHGLAKLFINGMPGVAAFFASLGYPGWLAWLTMAVEVLCGVMMCVGFFSRQAAIVALPFLVGAATVHVGNGWVFSSPGGGWEYPVFLVAAALTVACLGDGGYSLRTLRHLAQERRGH